jgi:hypothetical protein
MTESAEWLYGIEFKPGGSDGERTKIVSEPPLDAMLTGCLFYPSSGVDLRPIRLYGIQSAVYADYGWTQQDVEKTIFDDGFRGFDLLGHVWLNIDDLIPEPHKPDFFEQEQDKHLERPPAGPHSLENHFDWGHADPRRLEMEKEKRAKTPFVSWYVFEKRRTDQGSTENRRVSLLYCGAEAIAVFQQLFGKRNLAPDYIAIIRPGTGFGGNWTDFRDEQGLLAKSVRKVASESAPRLLISDVPNGHWPVMFPNRSKRQYKEQLKENTFYLTERKS